MKSLKKEAPGSDAGGRKISLPLSASSRDLSREKTVPDDILKDQRQTTNKVRAAKSPQTDQLLKDMDAIEDIAKRRRGRMFLIAERVRRLFIPDGITTQPIKGHSLDESCDIDMTFGQGEYIDPMGKRREHRWKITIENMDCMTEAVCPECEGELETEILDDGKRRVACDDCGYEHSSFCGVEVQP